MSGKRDAGVAGEEVLMKSGMAWLRVLAGLAVLAVAASATAQAVRQGSWGPVLSVSWLLAVVAAVWPWAGRGGRCLGRSAGQGGAVR